MKNRLKTFGAVAIASSLAFAVAVPRAMEIDPEAPVMPSGGWGNASGQSTFDGQYVTDLPGVTVWGKRPDQLAPVYVINAPPAGPPPTPHVDIGGGGAPDPVSQTQCIADCDTKQKLTKDMCDVVAAKAAAAGTVAAIGVGFTAAGSITAKSNIYLGAAAGFIAYTTARELAKDNAATMNLACIGQAAVDHSNCVKGTCKFTG